jgi:hypothetical protein
MTDFTVPDDFAVLGGDHDVSGVSQISPRKTIGGGSSVDGSDETDAWLRNARYGWTQVCRCNIFDCWSYGDSSPQAALHVEPLTSYQAVWEVPVTLADSRLSFTCLTELTYGVVKYEVFSAGGVSRGSVESNGGADAGATQNLFEDTLTAASTDVAYLVISVKGEAAGSSTVFGLRVHEDASPI